MGAPQELSPLARVIQTLSEKKIRFQVVGMAAAILQGVPSTTLDIDFWVDLPERSYMKLMNLFLKQGCTMLRSTVLLLQDESLVNFCFRIDGVGSFDKEYRGALKMELEGQPVRIMPLAKIIKSKTVVGREKDLAQLPALNTALHLAARLRKAKGGPARQ